jgi:hypothetical protein
MPDPALSRLRALAECLRRCRLPAERVVAILYAAIGAAPASSIPLGALYQALPEVREMAAALTLCGLLLERGGRSARRGDGRDELRRGAREA